jgi:hypothetical protein
MKKYLRAEIRPGSALRFCRRSVRRRGRQNETHDSIRPGLPSNSERPSVNGHVGSTHFCRHAPVEDSFFAQSFQKDREIVSHFRAPARFIIY